MQLKKYRHNELKTDVAPTGAVMMWAQCALRKGHEMLTRRVVL